MARIDRRHPIGRGRIMTFESQQQGLHSKGYTGGLLTGQEKRIQRFHEPLNDLMA